jgi:hypothetical protein
LLKKNKGYYKNFKLIDFDNFKKEKDRYSKKLLSFNKNTILFGSDESSVEDNVIYIYVILSKKNMKRNLTNREILIPLIQYFSILFNCGWTSPNKIINRRNELQRSLIKDNELVKPLFYSFYDAINYCYDIYNSN